MNRLLHGLCACAPRFAPVAGWLALGLTVGTFAGCQMVPELPRSQGGDLTLTGRTLLARAKTVFESDQYPTEAFHFDHGWYTCEGKQTAVFVLLQGTEEKPTAAAIVRVLWRPTAGSTPIDEHAGNATLRLLDLSPQAEQLWIGAGFLYLEDAPKHLMMNAQCWNADMMRQAGNARDLLGPAQGKGAFTAEYAPEKTAQWLKQLEAKERELFPVKPAPAK